ncbi:hypothetical protein OP10G_0592 [Fimbriimonas ginsengisoli Gsoil 348]|uniref:DUF1800 domain-containing protein n=1 Tax=Fimbriimonas ginsengisoli Gsoil 348 TaxID=661478 RepID=A0A068NMF1_FIMGI|nr:hypothetical protein OP10G_0592 [Fimbriimonas ginsengisoli Gsoil 348]
MDAAEKIGLHATIDALIDYREALEPSPYEFYWREKEEPDLGSWRTRAWWVYNMLVTPTPLKEKLTLFWHSHFPVSDGKVEDGPMMLDYVQTLREHAAAPFPKLLTAIAKNPAMMRYLDMERAVRGRPNENFAREVMELFTMGIGNYDEADVKEVARSLTGWGYLNTFYEMPGNTEQKVRDALRDGRPFSTFIDMPAMRDDGPKKILGKSRDWKGEQVLEMLAKQPATSERIARRLWEFFAYQHPETKPVAAIARVFQTSVGDIRKTLHAMVRQEEFWSDRCFRGLVKSPAEFCIGIVRAQGSAAELRRLRDQAASPYTPIPKKVMDNAGHIAYRMERMGLSLLYPVDVSGWKWGDAWATPAMMGERGMFTGLLLWDDKGPGAGSKTPLEFVKGKGAKTSEEIASAICELFDVELPEASMKVVAKAVGDPRSLNDPGWWAGSLNRAIRVLVAAPEMHMM